VTGEKPRDGPVCPCRPGPLEHDEEALRRDVERTLRAEGVSGRVVRVFPPHDTGGDVEVLLLGKDETPYKAYLRPHVEEPGEPVIEAGW